MRLLWGPLLHGLCSSLTPCWWWGGHYACLFYLENIFFFLRKKEKCCGLGRMLRPSHAGFWGQRAGSGCCLWAEATRQGEALPPAASAVWRAGPLESTFPGWDLGVPSSPLFCRATKPRGRKWRAAPWLLVGIPIVSPC